VKIHNSDYEFIDLITNSSNVYEINWRKNYPYQWYGEKPYSKPYVFISNQKDYDFLRTKKSEYIDFDKYVLFFGLFDLLYNVNIPSLGVYFDNSAQELLFYFEINERVVKSPPRGIGTQSIPVRVSKTITYLIPRKYFNENIIIKYCNFH
jgi:hypothetical protein